MLLDVLHHLAPTVPFVVPGPLVVDIAQRPLNRLGPRTVRRQPEQRNTRVAGPPLLDGFRLMHTVVLHHDIDARDPWRWVRPVQQGQEVAKSPVVFARAEAREPCPGGAMPRTSQSVL